MLQRKVGIIAIMKKTHIIVVKEIGLDPRQPIWSNPMPFGPMINKSTVKQSNVSMKLGMVSMRHPNTNPAVYGIERLAILLIKRRILVRNNNVPMI